MKVFEYQEFLDRTTSQLIGVVVFDPATQELELDFPDSTVENIDMQMLTAYLKKELVQMKEKMMSGLDFTPFSSLNQITRLLLPVEDASAYFSLQRTVVAADIIQALNDVK